MDKSLGIRRSAGGFCVAGVGLGALPRGRMYALASLGLRRSAGGFCVAGVGLGALQGVGCTPWRHLVSTALPWLLHGRRGTWCTAQGRMYALASLGLRRSATSHTYTYV